MQSCLPRERFVVFVVSTTGQGDPPDSMIDSFMSPAIKFHDDGEQPHMLRMVCSISFSGLAARINVSFILFADIEVDLNLFNLSVSLFPLFFESITVRISACSITNTYIYFY
jgi:hypothetical protein